MRYDTRVRLNLPPVTGIVQTWTRRSHIRSNHRGIININGAASNTAALNPAVDLANSIIRFIGVTNAVLDQGDMLARVELTNSTTVTALRFNASANDTTLAYEVIEYIPGLIRTVQRAAFTQDVNAKIVNIATSVNLLKSELFYLGVRVNTGVPVPSFIGSYLELINSTQLQSTSGTASNQEVGYQIVEWY